MIQIKAEFYIKAFMRNFNKKRSQIKFETQNSKIEW